MSKPKVAFYWCASCGGCEEAVVELAEDILGVVEAVDIVYWPGALDAKRADVEAKPDHNLAVTYLNGAIRTSEQEEIQHLRPAHAPGGRTRGIELRRAGAARRADHRLRRRAADAVVLLQSTTWSTASCA